MDSPIVKNKKSKSPDKGDSLHKLEENAFYVRLEKALTKIIKKDNYNEQVNWSGKGAVIYRGSTAIEKWHI